MTISINVRLADLEQKLDFAARASNTLHGHVARLELALGELRNEMSLLASIQRTCFDLDARLTGVERRLGHVAPLTQSTPTKLLFPATQELVRLVEDMFDCRDGKHSAWLEVDGTIYYYMTLAAIVSSDPRVDPQAILRQVLYDAFVKLRSTCKTPRPKLYWRFAEQERIQEEKEGGFFESSVYNYKIRTRVAIPEADFTVLGALVHPDGGVIMEVFV